MKKETTAAIIFGVIFGSILAVVLVLRNKQAQLKQSKTLTKVVSVTPIAKSNASEFTQLELLEPKDEIISDKNSVNIKGKVAKNSTIIIQSPIRDLVIKADKEDFSTNFPLAYGENVISVTAYSTDSVGKTQTRELKVYYLESDL